MNSFLQSRLNQISGTPFGTLNSDTAEHWARNDALAAIYAYLDGQEKEATFHDALDALETMAGGTRIKQLTSSVRECAEYDPDIRDMAIQEPMRRLKKYVQYQMPIA